MRRIVARARALRARGVLGINQRNGAFVLPLNPREHYPRVDDKLITKRLAQAAGIPTPTLHGVIVIQRQLRDLPRMLAGRSSFVLKPGRGAQGNGIVVITESDGNGGFRKSSGARLSETALRQHVSNTISGLFSLRGDVDACLIEERIVLHPAFAPIARFGVPDVRVIVYRGLPVMAMCRLPTELSDGRANLHQGAIGAGVAIRDGRIVHAALRNQSVTHHADTGEPVVGFTIPLWEQVLSLALRSAEMCGLGYLGVDIVIDAVHGPQLLELNARPGLAIQVANAEGLVPRLRRAGQVPAAALTTWSDRLQLARELF
jgi:alpha-L-glutamate ligase-like protein